MGWYSKIYKEKIFLTTGDGMFLFFDLKQLNNEKLNLKKIKSNIKEVIFTDIYNNANDDQYSTTIIGKSIKDLKIINEELFISFHNEVKRDCFNTSILKAKINFDFLNFEKFFVPSECVNKENEYGEILSVDSLKKNTWNIRIDRPTSSSTRFFSIKSLQDSEKREIINSDELTNDTLTEKLTHEISTGFCRQ